MANVKKKQPTPRIPKEGYEQQLVVRWLRQRKVLFYAVPNGGWKNARAAEGQKWLGVQKGVPDLCITEPRGKYHGLYIEMKRRKSTPSRTTPEQRWWIKQLNDRDYFACVCKGHAEAINVIKRYLGGDFNGICR